MACSTKRTMRMAMLVAMVLMVVMVSRRADACSAPSCWPSAVLPGNGATVPANLPAFRWRPGSGFGGTADAGAVTLVNVDGGVEVPLTYSVSAGVHLFAPAALQAGEQYEFDDGFGCGGTVPARVSITDAAPLPTTLGTLELGPLTVEPLTVMTTAGSCSDLITAAQVGAQLHLSPDAEPWAAALFFETLVDGQPWTASHSILSSGAFGGSWEGRGEDLFYRRCSESTTVWAGLPAGAHQAVLRASVPGSSVVLETAPVTFVLSCDGDAGTGEGDDELVAVTHAGGKRLERCGCSSGAGALVMLGLLALRRRRAQ